MSLATLQAKGAFTWASRAFTQVLSSTSRRWNPKRQGWGKVDMALGSQARELHFSIFSFNCNWQVKPPDLII